MNGLELIYKLPRQPMGMAKHFSLEIVEAERGSIVVSAIPTRAHYNPFEVVQNGRVILAEAKLYDKLIRFLPSLSRPAS